MTEFPDRIIRFFVFAGMALLAVACRDVLVPDISSESVVLISPPDGTRTTSREITFQWAGLPDAEGYNFQIGNPGFDSLILLVVDTNLTGTVFTASLPAGRYEWSVAGYNEAFFSGCCEIFSLTILSDTLDDLSQQAIGLISPADHAFINKNQVVFLWEDMPRAEQYFFQLAANPQFAQPLKLEVLSSESTGAELAQEGTYYWRVRGENNLSQTFTPWAERTFTIDKSRPTPPILSLPVTGDTIRLADQSPDLQWAVASDVVKDSVYIYSDAGLSNLRLKTLSSTGNLNLDNSGAVFPPGAYYWRVKSYDAAGNASDFSNISHFFTRD